MEIHCLGRTRWTILASHSLAMTAQLLISWRRGQLSSPMCTAWTRSSPLLLLRTSWDFAVFTAFYGSNCWDFSTAEVKRFVKTCNVNIQIMFDLPRESHSWIVEEISGGKHFLQMIYSRFSKYISVLKKNKRLSIRTLYSISANDVRTTTGSNVRKILLKSGIDPQFVPKQKFLDWKVYSLLIPGQVTPLLTPGADVSCMGGQYWYWTRWVFWKWRDQFYEWSRM